MMEEKIANAIHAILLIAICCGTMYFAHTLWEISRSPATKVEIQYDCRIAEISVDYPQQVKEQCRKLMMPTVKEFK
jgi:hypothetical protein